MTIDAPMHSTESVDTVHGRLMEGVHIAGYTLERAFAELKWILTDGRWRQVGRGFDSLDKFMATLSWSGFRHSVEQRKEIAKLIKQEGGGQRATARILGCSEQSVARSLGKTRGNAPKGALGQSTETENGASEGDSAPSGAPWLPTTTLAHTGGCTAMA
jgi:hypothetical protein